MDDGRWETGFLVLEREFIDKHGEQPRMIHMVTD